MRHVNAFRAAHDVEVAAAAQRRCCVREKLNRASGGLRREANRNPRAGASRFPYPARGAVCDASGSPFLPAPYLVEPGVLIVPLKEPEVEAKAGKVVWSTSRSIVNPPVAP